LKRYRELSVSTYRVQRKRGRTCGSGCVKHGENMMCTESRGKGKETGERSERDRRAPPVTPLSKPHTRSTRAFRGNIPRVFNSAYQCPYSDAHAGAHMGVPRPSASISSAIQIVRYGACGTLRGSQVRSGREFTPPRLNIDIDVAHVRVLQRLEATIGRARSRGLLRSRKARPIGTMSAGRRGGRMYSHTRYSPK
jgi:hypothetical protein